ncbi:MAG: hypothetical protein ACE5NJ_10260, partial [Thermodesulfobacteriota bacterium]
DYSAFPYLLFNAPGRFEIAGSVTIVQKLSLPVNRESKLRVVSGREGALGVEGRRKNAHGKLIHRHCI